LLPGRHIVMIGIAMRLACLQHRNDREPAFLGGAAPGGDCNVMDLQAA
jgi:hypothetical protein